jgi:2-oxoglutarate ferredoxin oxidoreductase subunit gamma
MLECKEVTWFPSYGAEIRGGTANCTVIISDALIGSPVVMNPDILIVMSDASLNRFLPRLKQDGFLLFDSSLIQETNLRDDIEITGVPATEIANKIGDTKSANMVMLGALIAKTSLLHKKTVFEAIVNSMPERKKKSIEDNKKAVIEGMRFIEDKKS